MATRKAGHSALSRFANAIKGGRGKKYSLDDDDLLNDHEKLKLTSRSEG